MKRGLFFAILVNILLLAFSFTSNAYSNIPDKTKDHYVDLIDEYYKEYNIIDASTNDYSLMIVEGICNNDFSYGFCLVHKQDTRYSIEVLINGLSYKTNTDEVGDVCYIALKDTGNVIVNLYESDDIKVYEYKVNTNHLYEFQGKDKGYSFEYVLLSDTKYILIHVALISLGVVALAFIVILIFKINKIGMFNPERKKEIEEKVKQELKEYDDEYQYDDEYVDAYEVQDDKEENESPKIIHEYIDLDKYFEEHNLSRDYENLCEKEKEEIMLQLMYLKDNSLIDLETYEDEIARLWKK